MCTKLTQLLAGLAMILGTAASEAQATVITFAFSGTITSVSDPNGILGGGVSVGDPFDGVYSFESTTPDIFPDEPRRGLYVDPLIDLSGEVGGLSFVGPMAFGSFIDVRDGFLSPTIDSYELEAQVELLGRSPLFALDLLDGTGLAFEADALPQAPPELEVFDFARFILGSETAGFGLSGELFMLALVPEPATFCILGLGILFVGIRRRTRKVNRRVSH